MDTVSVYGSKYVLPACQFTAPKNGRDVMVFAGWRVNDIQVVFPAGTPVDITGDTVLKAVWTKTTLTTYTVFFDANGGDGIYGPVCISAGTYTLPKCYFTAPAGKQFKAWEAVGVEYAPGNVITISSNTAVKAIWEDIYVVSFNANGGEGTLAPHTMTEGEYVLPECTFTPPAGMQFKTWKISTGEYAPGEKITVSDHVSVNAVWEAVPVTKTPITSVKVSDVTEPVIGAKPDYDVTLTGEGAALAEYDGEWEAVTWVKYNPEAGGWETMDKDTPFEAGFYSLSVVLQPEEGYTFTYDTEFYYNDDKLSEFGGSDDPCYNWWDEIVEIYLYFTLEDTATEKITSLSATVTVPVAGASPSFEAVVGGEGYTAELEWEIVAEETIIYPEDNYKFKAGEKYGLWLAFIPADGYGFADDVTITINGMIPEGMYELAGNMICLVTYTIPAPAPITSVKVSDVTEPVFGAKPDFDITLTGDGVTFDAEEGIGYAWLKVEPEVHHRELLDEDTPFGEGLYALFVYLKPEAGYEFTDATKFYYGEKELPEYDGRDESCYDCYGDGADIYLYFTVEETITLVDSSKKFTDVSATSWAKPGIDYVVTYGYMNGTGNGTTFSPSATMSRSMIVTVLYRIAGQPSHSGYNPFADITTGWYYDAVLWAYENGIVTGTSATTFAPDGAVTREQMATFLYRFAKYMGYDVTRTNDITTFPDADKVGSWAYDALAWANAEGLITGAKGNDGVTRLDPQGNATREQVATILMRFCKAFVE